MTHNRSNFFGQGALSAQYTVKSRSFDAEGRLKADMDIVSDVDVAHGYNLQMT